MMHKEHYVDFCVVGGGLSGVCAAIAAARHKTKVALVQNRSVLGGNASSEIRMWIGGCHGKDNREGGIIEEIMLENFYQNPSLKYPLWDSVLYEKAIAESNITLLLNSSCLDCTMDGEKIVSIKAWQSNAETFHSVTAKYFADCSGDSILAPLTGAEFMRGRESKEVFGEATHVEKSDDLTMGMSCLIQAREGHESVKFIPGERATKLNDEHFKFRKPNMRAEHENFWYLELGGNKNTIDDTEKLRDELVALATGTWDYIKNSGEFNSSNWDLDFLGFLPGKRESRRMFYSFKPELVVDFSCVNSIISSACSPISSPSFLQNPYL